jgi:hypothetical protein
MNIKQTTAGRTVKTVTFENVTTETDDEIRNAAYAATGESQSSTFGTHITRHEGYGTVTVSVYTD